MKPFNCSAFLTAFAVLLWIYGVGNMFLGAPDLHGMHKMIAEIGGLMLMAVYFGNTFA